MQNIYEAKDILNQIMNMLEKQFGKNCEVVLHDHTLDYDRTIVDIRNGHVTGRAIGGCGSNLGLEILRGSSEGGDYYNYVTYTNNGKVLRSSSIHFHNAENEMIGALCVNLDITDSVRFENFLKEYNNCSTSPEPVDEIFVSDVQQLLDELIKRAFQKAGKAAPQMNREEKIEFIRYLDDKGAFIISKSGERIEEVLGISRYTFYNYLEAARKKNSEEK